MVGSECFAPGGHCILVLLFNGLLLFFNYEYNVGKRYRFVVNEVKKKKDIIKTRLSLNFFYELASEKVKNTILICGIYLTGRIHELPIVTGFIVHILF